MVGRRPAVVSLVPSATETLVALGAPPVACTRFCEQPQLAHVGGTKNPDIAAIVALAPDLVVVDTEENRREDADALRSARVELVLLSVRSMADSAAAVTTLAAVAGVAAPPASAPWSRPPSAAPARAFVPIWRRPWMSINAHTYGASLLAELGVTVVTADDERPYPEVELDQIAALAPDMIVVPSEPYEFSVAHVDELAAAVPGAVIHRVDGQDLFWWGIRTPAARERLAAALNRR